jgi:hypothetical protein
LCAMHDRIHESPPSGCDSRGASLKKRPFACRQQSRWLWPRSLMPPCGGLRPESWTPCDTRRAAWFPARRGVASPSSRQYRLPPAFHRPADGSATDCTVQSLSAATPPSAQPQSSSLAGYGDCRSTEP